MKPIALVVFILLLVLLVVDLGFVVFGGTKSSVSAFVVENYGYDPDTFIAGIVIGHLFFGMREKKDG